MDGPDTLFVAHTRPRRRVLVAAALLAGLALSPPAQAAVTIGSDLTSTPTDPDVCTTTCTFVQTALPGSAGVLAPSAGILTRMRVKTAGPASSVRLRVLRPTAGGQYIAVRSSRTMVTSSAGGVETFALMPGLPVQAGDAIGLDVDNVAIVIAAPTPGATAAYWDPRIADTETSAPDDITSDEQLFNADLEPDGDGDGYGDESQDGCPLDPATQFGPCPADFAVTSVASTSAADPGQVVTSTITVTNLGPFAGRASLTWSLNGVTMHLVSASTAGCALNTTRPVFPSCDLGELPAGTTRTLSAQVRSPEDGALLPPGGRMISAASVMSPADRNFANNQAMTAWDVRRGSSAPSRMSMSLALRAQRLGTVLARGLRVRASCTAACRGRLTATIDRQTARRYKLPAKVPYVVGRATWKLASAGTINTTIKLNTRARQRLAHARRVRLTIVASATGMRTVRRAVTLKR
jgi:hypothetical protein